MKTKFALINGERKEATKGAKGICALCGSELVAKCGDIKIHHWAHKGNLICDPWWENETEWHRSWKDKFPKEWQEVIHTDDNSGEKHIADVKTKEGWVLEFQHSNLKPDERGARNNFYKKIIWVVDGLRRKTDVKKFEDIIENSISVSEDGLIRRVRHPDESRLLKEWHDNNALVFFDFQQSLLWFLFPKTLANNAYISFLSRDNFIKMNNNNEFNNLIKNNIEPIRNKLAQNEQIEQQYQQDKNNILINRNLNAYINRQGLRRL